MRPAAPALLAAALGFAGPAWAATFTVDTTADAVDAAPGDGVCAAAGGSCTLRAAVMEANALPGPDTIVLPAGRYTLTLAGAGEDAAATGDLDVLSDVTILGAGPAVTIIDGGGIDRVFDNLDTLRLTSLTVEGGRNLDTSFDGGGGGIVNAAFLYLTDVVVRGNTAAVGGGGILNYSDLFISDSTIEANTVVASDPPSPRLGGGGIGNESNLRLDRSTVRGNSAPFGGGLANDANAFVTTSTLSGNSAADAGGGIWNNSNLTVVSSTVSANSALVGNGIYDAFGTNDRLVGVTLDGDLAFAGLTEIGNSILTGACVLTTDGPGIVSHGHNLAREAGCNLTTETDLLGDPLLGPLQDNGGPTGTMALLPGSPARDAGGDEPVSLPGWSGGFTGSCPATDQRGIGRPQGPHCDIGAYEAVSAVPTRCDEPAIAAPDDFMLRGHGWSAEVSVSASDGLVLENVRLGPRYLARRMSVPYFRLQTSALEMTRGELTPRGDQAVARSRLIGFSRHEPAVDEADPAWVEAVYAVDRIPAGSSSCLVVTQRYQLEQEKPHGGCEPSESIPSPPRLLPPLNCSPWRPSVRYDFSGGPGETLREFNAPLRLHFRDDNRSINFASLFEDNDAGEFPPTVSRYDVYTEYRQRIIKSGSRASQWDNYHQSFTIVLPPLIGPGCAECVHLHWRWGKGVPDAFPDKNDGKPLVPDGSDQDVEIAVTAFHPGEEDPGDFHDLIQDENVNLGMVFWYSGTGHQASDTFFGRHGGFFQPVERADAALSGSAPASVRSGEDLPLTFTVTNQGPSFATGVRIQTDRLPLSRLYTPVPGSSSPGCEVHGRFSVVCLLGDMAPGTSRTVTVVVRPATRFGGRVETVTVVRGQRTDPVPGNNRVVLRTTVTP